MHGIAIMLIAVICSASFLSLANVQGKQPIRIKPLLMVVVMVLLQRNRFQYF